MMKSEFEIATENLYKTFSKYPFKSTIEGCPCCVSDSDKLTLHSKQLRELEDDDLSRYAFKAMTTWGDLNDYKHYLPRIFELSAKRKLMVDTSVTLGKLDYAQWEEWDKEEQESVTDFLTAWWKYDINNATYFDTVVLIELLKYLKDLNSMLKSWNVNIYTQGFKNYVELIEFYYYEIAGKNISFKILTSEELKIFKNWIISNVGQLESGFFKFEKYDKEFSERISNALYIIETMK